MSDQPPRVRRSAARVVPIGPVESASAAQRTASVFKVPSSRPGVRARAYGAPLVAGDRTSASGRTPNGRSRIDAPDAPEKQTNGSSEVAVVGSPYAASLDAGAGVAPVIFWDQPPTPESDIDENDMLPRWVNDVSLQPSELQYQDLGTYLAFMAEGFSDFCRSQYIVETGLWQGRMRMPPKILPETTLQLEVSAFHAMLRFETDHPISREILKRHCDTLRAQVSAALEDSRPVEVSIW